MHVCKQMKSLESIGRRNDVDRVDRFDFVKFGILARRSINGVF